MKLLNLKKHSFYTYVLVALILICMMPLLQSASATLVNLNTNSGFEDGTGTTAYNWTFTPTTDRVFERTNAEAYEGDYSFNMHINTTGTGNLYGSYFPIEEGNVTAVSCRIKLSFDVAESDSGAYLTFYVKNSTNEVVGTYLGGYHATADWTQYIFFYSIPQGYGYTEGRLRLNFAITNNIGANFGDVWWDNVNVYNMGSPYEAGNAVPNPKFESIVDAAPVSWAYENSGNFVKNVSNTEACGGNYSYFTQLKTTASDLQAYSNYFPITEGLTYNLTYAAKTEIPIANSVQYYLVLQAKNSTNTVSIGYSDTVKTSADWKEFRAKITIPSGQSYTEARLGVIFMRLNTTGFTEAHAWTDNIKLEVFHASYIVSQPLMIQDTALPKSINFSAKIINGTTLTDPETAFDVLLDGEVLPKDSVTYNATTDLFDVSATIPANVGGGKHTLKLEYDGQLSYNYKGINVYSSSSYGFCQLTDVHMWLSQESVINTTLAMIVEQNPAFIMLTGDLGYSETDYIRFYELLTAYNLDSTPVFFINGNHEKDTLTILQTSSLYMSSSNQIGNYEYPYSFDVGDIHYLMIDTAIAFANSEGNITDAQYTWIVNDLANTEKQTLAFMHHSLYFDSGIGSYWTDSTIAVNIIDLFESNNVEYCISGHTHYSDISVLNGIKYITTTSGINDTHWYGVSPYPYAGFRVFNIEDGAVASYHTVQTVSYYTGALIDATYQTLNGVPLNQIYKINGVQVADIYK